MSLWNFNIADKLQDICVCIWRYGEYIVEQKKSNSKETPLCCFLMMKFP